MIVWLLAAAASAQALGVIEMPYTPSDGTTEYVTLAAHKGASGTWEADAAGFLCRPLGEYVEIRVDPDAWPSEIPSKVTCAEVGGKGKVKAKIQIREGKHEAMFVSDGTLVMPRGARTSSLYAGPPPAGPELIVGQGKSETLGITCRVEAGPVLHVAVAPDQPDGEGRCGVKTKAGTVFWVPVKIVTVGR